MIRASVLADQHLLKLGSYLPHRDWETEALSFMEIIFKKKKSERRFTVQRNGERVYNGNFS